MFVLLAAQVGCFYESQRFSSIFNALQYDLILLTGDYPLIDFTLLGRYINFVQVRGSSQGVGFFVCCVLAGVTR